MKSVKLTVIVAYCMLFLSGCSYNKMVSKQEAVASQWGQVENVYQRRADLIPNLVSTVKGYAAHESQTLQAVTEARSKATQITVDPENLTAEKLKEYQNAQGAVGSALGRLISISENYPELKADQNFRDLQAQLEGTENRISVERNKFNTVVQEYNTYIRQFPRNIYAGWFGFEKKAYFEAKEGADVAPKVEF
ncbi:MAG: LemA family protein [Dysgonamonadaceae bacterium]|jgi:LemA protein|nr:LemA family protein [Dysgonamonadaceae bacterium]